MNHADMQFLGTAFSFANKYGNFFGGEWVPPVRGDDFDNVTPITGGAFTSIPRSTAEDIALALDAAHRARASWAQTSPATRANILN